MTTVPLVHYDDHGERTVIGSAEISAVGNGYEVSADIHDSRYERMLRGPIRKGDLSVAFRANQPVEVAPYLRPVSPTKRTTTKRNQS